MTEHDEELKGWGCLLVCIVMGTLFIFFCLVAKCQNI